LFVRLSPEKKVPPHFTENAKNGYLFLPVALEKMGIQNGPIQKYLSINLVPKKGLEPPHPCGYMDLNHARLPIPPLRQGDAPDNNPALRQEDLIYFKRFAECVKSAGAGSVAVTKAFPQEICGPQPPPAALNNVLGTRALRSAGFRTLEQRAYSHRTLF
jgi:hypothetical protein